MLVNEISAKWGALQSFAFMPEPVVRGAESDEILGCIRSSFPSGDDVMELHPPRTPANRSILIASLASPAIA